MRALVRRVPRTVVVSVRFARAEAALSASSCVLAKLATLGGPVRLGHVEWTDDPALQRVELRSGERAIVFAADRLASDVRELARVALVALFDERELLAVAEAFAANEAKLDALHTLTRLMLRSTDLDRALYVMLLGATSGEALAFHRASLFLHDEARGVYVGSKAIGPVDAAEAHRIWEEIEAEKKTLEALVEDYALARIDTRLQDVVRTIELARGDEADDEIALAEAASAPVLFTRGTAVNASFRRLGLAHEFLVAALRPHDAPVALLVCDSPFGGEPITAERVAWLATFVAQTGLVWENLSLLDRVERLARTDALTGVLSRRELEARLAEESARAARTERPLSVLVLDVDRFKEINDAQGHAAGDDVLRRLGALLRANVRAGDHVGRLGGDEFVVVLPETSDAEASTVARRIGDGAKAVGISLSLGGATWPTGAEPLETLLATADARLYSAKRDGRGRGFLGGQAVVFAPLPT